jgi:hypothetical protein
MCGTKDVITAGYPNVPWSAQRDTGRVRASVPCFCGCAAAFSDDR